MLKRHTLEHGPIVSIVKAVYPSIHISAMLLHVLAPPLEFYVVRVGIAEKSIVTAKMISSYTKLRVQKRKIVVTTIYDLLW